MAINTVTVSSATNWVHAVWASELSDASQAWTGLSDLVDRQYEDEMSIGDVIEIPDAANPAVRFKSADVAGTYSNVTETNQNVTINLQAYVAFLVEDIAELQSQYAVRSTYTSKATYSLMSTVEGDATSGLASAPDNFSQLVGSLGVEPTTDNMIRAVQYLDDGDVPEGDRFFYMSPSTHASLLKQDVFVSGDYGPSGAVGSGRISKPVYGATTHVSSLANNNPSTAAQSYSWFCHKKGVALIMQRKPQIHTVYDLLNFGWGVGVDCIYNFVERLILPSTLASTTPDDRFNVGIRGA